MSLSMGNMRTSLVLFNIDRGPAYLGLSGVFEIAGQSGYLDIGPAYLGVSGEFEYGEYADQSSA